VPAILCGEGIARSLELALTIAGALVLFMQSAEGSNSTTRRQQTLAAAGSPSTYNVTIAALCMCNTN
jgi:hypothetical protein